MQFDQIKNAIFEIFRKNAGYFLATGLALAFSLVAAYGLNIFLPGTFIIIIFFLIIPLLGCMIINNVQYSAGKGYNLKDFYRGYRVTLLPGLHGAFRMIRSFIFAALISLATFLVIYEGCSLFMNVIDPNLVSAIESAKSQTEIFEILQAFYEDPASEKYLNMYSIFYLISFGTGLFFFIHFVMKSVPIFYIQSNIACSKKDAIYLYNQVYPTNKKTYSKLIFKVCGLYYLIYPVSYLIGGFIGWTVFKDVQYMILIAMILTLISTLPFLSLYLLCQDTLYRVYAPVYKTKAKSLFEIALKNVDDDPRISEEQKEVVKKFYNDQLSEIERLEKTEILTHLSSTDLAERDHKQPDKNDDNKDE